jgi:hypothetical protein
MMLFICDSYTATLPLTANEEEVEPVIWVLITDIEDE